MRGDAWCDARMCAVDLETTGPEPDDARIVTASIALVGGGEPVTAFDWLADPGVEIPESATEVHGITTDQAREHGRPAIDVVREVLVVLEHRPPGSPLVAFNARFDLTVLDREARRHALMPLQDRGPLLVVDPRVLDAWLDRYRRGSRKLDATCAHYGVRLDRDDSHGADVDAIAAARLAWRLGHSGRVIRRRAHERKPLQAEWERVRHNLPLLHEFQREIAYAEAVRLQAYFRQGNPAKGVPPQPDRVVEPEWPVVPVREAAAA